VTEKIKKIRADAFLSSDDVPKIVVAEHIFNLGFSEAWKLHEKLVGPLIETLRHYGVNHRDNYGYHCDKDDRAKATIEKYKEEVGE
jgi:hypothetical protein